MLLKKLNKLLITYYYALFLFKIHEGTYSGWPNWTSGADRQYKRIMQMVRSAPRRSPLQMDLHCLTGFPTIIAAWLDPGRTLKQRERRNNNDLVLLSATSFISLKALLCKYSQMCHYVLCLRMQSPLVLIAFDYGSISSVLRDIRHHFLKCPII